MKHPLVLFEGVDATGKSTIARELAKLLDAQVYESPPQALRPLKQEILELPAMARYHFFALGNWIAAREVERLLDNGPVCMVKSSYATAAFHSALLGEALEAEDTGLEPDLLVYVSAAWDEIERRLEQRGRRNQYEAAALLKATSREYARLLSGEDRLLCIDTTRRSAEEVAKEISERLKTPGSPS